MTADEVMLLLAYVYYDACNFATMLVCQQHYLKTFTAIIMQYIIIKKIIIIMTDLYSAFRFEDTEALDAAQEDK